MAKKGKIENNNKRKELVEQYAAKREALRAITKDRELPMEERFAAQLELAAMPRNSAPNRVKNRCQVTGRPKAYYRKMQMSRIALRELGSEGKVPGLVKSSW
ncbi:30S ribosomal protein S14 [Acuticoccus sp. MNP-M23]|uniref:30S ribosomal protein S14 n=1 Tax=Acuticoccus sp. MNP-M23 TaxID=3072793 RepID=UPI002816152E|nr:30S ribosomal protein S14 [Acuticoccus sp. MNP-M23]WMS41740.1 30S ribosomal protein S14 [Acuticoccus sp. MNP-M23]